MTTASIGLPAAARHFGVSIRTLRAAIRAGRLPRPEANGRSYLKIPLTIPRKFAEEA